ncbi:hypothetical protein [Enterovibrio coralii]|uniref:Lipoprotein n=1 Tax=Enterovibrio coralii TaxID=294935 RepID=A0A135I9E2_9GAMM|nr:hypothetical protein [Enterovibrio coralii]KXF82028.1 hypothetical protein ATN88_19600 [Enterovibrio coralii]
MFHFSSVMKKTAVIASLVTLAGCASVPVIDTSKITNVKSVTIVDIPEVRTHALVGQLPNTYGIVHFSDDLAAFYDTGKAQQTLNAQPLDTDLATAVVDNQLLNSPGMAPVEAGVTGAAGAMTASLINAMGGKANEKAANFNALFADKNPDLNIRKDFLNSLTDALEQRGVEVYLATDQSHKIPYFRWDAPKGKGESFQQRFPADLPTVDTDILLQVSPIILFNAQTALNAYAKITSVGVAVYNGRTKEFFGYQEIATVDGVFDYHHYDKLVEDLHIVGPEIHQQLLSLAPVIAAAFGEETTSE